jgi:hypothetical protein
MCLKVPASKTPRGVAGMLKYVSKIALDILPSVVATIIGAYIVNHYIVTKPSDAPVAAAVSSAEPKRVDIKNDATASEPPADVANIPEPGVKAKGISERAMLEKTASERPATVEKSAEKAADKPAETASIPVDARRHQPVMREKIIARTVPAPVQSSAPAVAPVVAAPNVAAPAEAATPAEEHRDANDLARAAIERLRGAGDGSPRTQDLARVPDAARVPDVSRVTSAPSVATPQVRPLPPPIMVSTPASEAYDPSRPTPPADIPSLPSSRPLDLRAEVVEPSAREHTTVAEDMLLAAKSVFHAVLPR